MIEFTLSKINLLILVIALFSIISFFSLNVGRIFLVGEVKQELERFSITLNGMIVGPTTCDSKHFAIPPKFTSFGNNVYYTLHISQTPATNGNRLILAVSDVRAPTTVLAAASLTTQADIALYDFEGGVTTLDEGVDLILNPQSVPPVNAFYAIKSVKLGNPTLHIFPCSITANSQTCYPDTTPNGSSNKERVDDFLSPDPNEEYFIC
jgi:hypothetical protein